jgi:hypothetical protein
LQTTSFRIGQITGGYANGAWATTDWVPIMLASSVALGCLADADGVSSWLPFDAVGQAILDVAFMKEAPEKALNLVHPRPTPWHDIMDAFSDSLVKCDVTKDRLLLVNMEQWFSKLQEANVEPSDETVKHIVSLLFIFLRACISDMSFSLPLNCSNSSVACHRAMSFGLRRRAVCPRFPRTSPKGRVEHCASFNPLMPAMLNSGSGTGRRKGYSPISDCGLDM